jgi:hypothetical protein
MPYGYVEVHRWFRRMFCLDLPGKRISQANSQQEAGGKQVILCMVDILKSRIMFIKSPKVRASLELLSQSVNLTPVEAHFPFHGSSLALAKERQCQYGMKITDLCRVRSIFHVI